MVDGGWWMGRGRDEGLSRIREAGPPRNRSPSWQHRLELAHELRDVLELPVHRREPHVGDVVEALQLAHDEVADRLRPHLAVVPPEEVALDLGDDVVDHLDGHGPLLAGHAQAGPDLLAVERLAAAVLLDHVEDAFLELLLRGEPALAGEALPATPDDAAVTGGARIDHAVVV